MSTVEVAQMLWFGEAGRVIVLVGIVVSLAGCGESVRREAERVRFIVRDSAGVRIAQSRSPEWRSGGGWRLAPEARLTIGEAVGDAGQQLYRVADALRLARDTIVLTNRGTSELRWYDGDGQLIRAVGRSGAGPGEFGEPLGPGSLCISPTEQLVVEDLIQRRVQIFSRSGDLLEITRLTTDANIPSIQACFTDGTLLALFSSEELVPGAHATIIHTFKVWSRLDTGSERTSDIVSLASAPRYLVEQPDGRSTRHSIPFTVQPSGVAGPDRLYAAAGPDPEVARYRLDGKVDMVIRWEPGERVQSAQVYDRYRAHVLDGQPPERRPFWARFFDLEPELPQEIASVESLMMDATEHLWVKRYQLPWDTPTVWDVFDPNGRWLGGVNMPERFEPLQIGRDFVLGLSWDDLGVERVQVYSLIREVSSGRR